MDFFEENVVRNILNLGLLSAALLVVGADRPPLSLRVDYARAPLEALADLHLRATSGDYARWTAHVPTLNDPDRATPFQS